MAQPRFSFTGEIKLPRAESKRPFLKKFSKDNVEMVSMNFGILESKGNIGFVEAFASVQKTIKTFNNDKDKIEIDWNDRFDESIVKSVANWKKYIVDLGDDHGGRKEFISQYDAILFLKEELPNYNGKVCITGQWQKQYYEGKYLDKFIFNNVYAVDDEHKNRLSITADIYYCKNCIDKEDWKADKKIYIDGFIQQYIDKNEGVKFVPQRFVFNASKYNLENEKHKKLLDYKLKYVECDKKKWHHLLWECVMQNGTEEIDFDESQLTQAQKEQIELGVKKLEDFKPNGSIFGDKILEFRLFDPSLKKTNEGDFSEGFIDCDLTDTEFDELVYQPPLKEKISSITEQAKTKEELNSINSESNEIDDDDLF